MAQEKKEEVVYDFVVPVLYLCCPGVGSTLGSGRKVALKSGGIKNPGVGNGDNVDLAGVSHDQKTIEHFIEKISTGKNALGFYKQKSSIYDPRLSGIETKFKIADWLCAKGNVGMLYFSGHGAKGYLCTSNKQKLTYSFIAQCIKCAKNADQKALIIIIDACYSGSVVDAFKDIKKPRITIHYSCGADETSADCGIGVGGWFTNKLFDPKADYFFGDGPPVPGTIHHYKDGDSKQTPGSWKNY
eukprot:234498_1